MLSLVGTPIGNLGDITYRAVEVLKSCDLLLAEDTRRTHILLTHYRIPPPPIISFHRFSERRQEDRVVTALTQGKEVALVSDAGLPLVADPGARLVKRCHHEGLKVQVVPGPCACTAALTLAGGEAPFQFIGYLEKKEVACKKQLISLLGYAGLSLAYISPHQLEKSLLLIECCLPQWKLALAKELTKWYEQLFWGTPRQLLDTLHAKGPIKGEYVLILFPHTVETFQKHEYARFLEHHFSLPSKEAVKLAARECWERARREGPHI